MIFARVAAALFATALLTAPAAAQAPSGAPVLTLDGHIKQPQHWTLDDLKKMPSEHVDVSFQTDHGLTKASFTGIPLWSLIETAGGLTDTEKGGAIRHAIRITAKDGWVVVTSTGEIAPDFGGKRALVAFERDGKPLDDFRIVMPGDKHGGRDARDVATITIE